MYTIFTTKRDQRSDDLLIVQTCQYTMIQFIYTWLLNFNP